MTNYEALARYYDVLTRDVRYEKFADYYEAMFRREDIRTRTILDIACGTGTLTCIMARRGYDMIGADMSEDMLAVAFDKASALTNKPMFINQAMEELDLYGTVGAVVCSMDGINYVLPDRLDNVFRRVFLFLEKGGLFIFDVQPPARLKAQDGQIFLDETDDVFCVWRAQFDESRNALVYGMDLFALEDRRWARYREEHIEYAYETDRLENMLIGAGFSNVAQYGDMTFEKPGTGEQRVFIKARKPE